MAKTQADERFKTDITLEQIKANLKVLAEFRTDVAFSSNLTIREGLFTKTTGKFNLFKKIVRDEQDSLSNQDVLTAIYTNLKRFRVESTFDDNDDNFDILCNAMYGFLLLGSKYRDRDTVENILTTMSDVCKMAQGFFEDRLEKRYVPEKTAAYSQGIYNRANKVHLEGTCWAMVMDWARRFVLKEKMGYAHGLQPLAFEQKDLLHRGKYIASVFDLGQNQNYPSVGAALINLQPKDKDTVARTNKLLQEYDKQRNSNSAKRTVVDKFNDLSYTSIAQGNGVDKLRTGDLGLGGIHIGNLDKSGKKNTRDLCIATLTNKIIQWIAEAKKNNMSRLAYGIGFRFDEKIGYQLWSVNKVRQKKLKKEDGKRQEMMIGNQVFYSGRRIVDQQGGHELGFAYDPNIEKCCFMDPNFGEWVSRDPNKIANLIYDVFKVYTVFQEKVFENPYYYCASINKTMISIFAKKI